MSVKKKVTPKAPEARAKYNVGQKLFAIHYYKGLPEELLEIEIVSRTTIEYAEKDASGKRIGTGVTFMYMAKTCNVPMNLAEKEIYPSYQSAANEFAKAFLFLLK